MTIAADAENERAQHQPRDRAGVLGRPRIALFGIFGVRNLGNECTLDAMLHNVRQRLPEAGVYSICYEPEDTVRQHHLPAIPITPRPAKASAVGQASGTTRLFARLLRIMFRRIPGEVLHWLAVARSLRGTDVVIMTGTGMLTDFSTNALGYPYDVFKWSLAAKLAGSKVRFVGIGVGPIHQALSRRFIQAALCCADYRSYRDDISRQRLVKLGLGSNKDPIFPDLAFSLPRSMFPSAKTPNRRPCTVGLGVMKFMDIHLDSEADREAGYERYLNSMCDFVAWLVGHGYAVRILQGDAKYDGSVRREVRRKLENRGIRYESAGIVDEESTCTDDLVAQLVQTDVVISPRFHNLVLAIMLNKPVLSISYDAKNDALLGGFGLAKYCQPIGDVNVGKLIEQFLEVESTSDQIRVRLRKTVDDYRTRLDEQYTVILSDLHAKQNITRSVPGSGEDRE